MWMKLLHINKAGQNYQEFAEVSNLKQLNLDEFGVVFHDQMVIVSGVSSNHQNFHNFNNWSKHLDKRSQNGPQK